MKTKYMTQRSVKRELHQNAGKVRGGRLYPLHCQVFKGSESGVVSQNVQVEMEPVAGNLQSSIHMRVRAVYVPLLAADVQANPGNEYPGNADIMRQRLMAGDNVFPLEPEGELTKAMNLGARRVDGAKQICSIVRHSHNAAVNFLRRRAYRDAVQLDNANDAVTPALLSSTALDYYNAVLDPEDRVNGAISFPDKIPVSGLYLRTTHTGQVIAENTYTNGTFSDTGGEHPRVNSSDPTNPPMWIVSGSASDSTATRAQVLIEQHPDDPTRPFINADFALAKDGPVLSLEEMFRSERMDELTRLCNYIVTQNPEYGEQMVTRMAYGFHVEADKQPFTVYDREVTMGKSVRPAMDGANLDVRQTETYAQINFTVPIPANEFGGCLLTFVEIKPQEVISNQPHPVLSLPWEQDNHMADELKIEPEPVYMRDLDSDVLQADEGTVAFYVGPNHLKRMYSKHGYNGLTDLTTVEHRNAIWQYEVPPSVSPDNVLYPEQLDHAPFLLNGPDDPAVSFVSASDARILSPTILGPTPIEDLDVFDTEDLFEELDQE